MICDDPLVSNSPPALATHAAVRRKKVMRVIWMNNFVRCVCISAYRSRKNNFKLVAKNFDWNKTILKIALPDTIMTHTKKVGYVWSWEQCMLIWTTAPIYSVSSRSRTKNEKNSRNITFCCGKISIRLRKTLLQIPRLEFDSFIFFSTVAWSKNLIASWLVADDHYNAFSVGERTFWQQDTIGSVKMYHFFAEWG